MCMWVEEEEEEEVAVVVVAAAATVVGSSVNDGGYKQEGFDNCRCRLLWHMLYSSISHSANPKIHPIVSSVLVLPTGER